MHVFITGASGFIGSAIARHLLASGHTVTGLARSGRSAAAVEAIGANVLRGSLDDPAVFAEGAKAADGVVHCAYHHDAEDPKQAAEADARAISAMGDVLSGSNRPLIVTAGTSGIAPGRVATEDDAIGPDYTSWTPRLSEQAALALAEKGVRASVVRLPPTVHGDGDAAYVPALIGFARNTGRSCFVGDGANRWPAVHLEDAVRLYALALEKSVAGTVCHGIGDEGIAFRDIASVIGDKLGVPVESVSAAEANLAFGWLARLAQFDVPASSRLTQDRLGWKPTHRGLIEDLREGTYFG